MSKLIVGIAAVVISLNCVATSQAAWELVDDFQNYFSGAQTMSPPWSYSSSGTTVQMVIANDGDQHLAVGWGGGPRGANRAVTPIVDGGSGSYYFQINTGDLTPEVSYGLSDMPTGYLQSFEDFEVELFLTTGGGGTNIQLGARDQGTRHESLVTNLNADTWYDIWITVDNTNDTYDLFFGTHGGQFGEPTELGTKIANDFRFRNGVASNDLGTFMILANYNDDRTARVDNINYNAEVVPEPSSFALAGLGLVGLAGWRLRRRQVG